MLENITIIIKTFERYESLDYLLSSIAKMNLPCPVLIADDSQADYRDKVLKKFGRLVDEYILLPFDSGASKGRNVLVDNVQTKYFLLCDDDFIFDKRTNLEFMLQCMENSDIELLGGVCYNRTLLIENKNNELLKNLVKLEFRTLWNIILWQIYQFEALRDLLPIFQKESVRDFHGNFEFENDICYFIRLAASDYTPPYTRCDFVPNFFLAKTQALKDKNVYWDEEIEFYGEHRDFFFRAKRHSLNVAFTKEVGIIHQRIHNAFYRRGRDDRDIMMRKNNIREIRIVDSLPD